VGVSRICHPHHGRLDDVRTRINSAAQPQSGVDGSESEASVGPTSPPPEGGRAVRGGAEGLDGLAHSDGSICHACGGLLFVVVELMTVSAACGTLGLDEAEVAKT
jgi:hypothetical protein